MLRIVTGDILSADVEAFVNTVNCVGVMGRGVALQFKRAFPDNFRRYEKACERGEVQPGRMFVVENTELTGPRYLTPLNRRSAGSPTFPTPAPDSPALPTW